MTDVAVCNNIIINIYSHCNDIRGSEIFKDFGDNDIGNIMQDRSSDSQLSSEGQVREESSQDVLGLSDINKLAEKPNEVGFGAEGSRVDLGDFSLQLITDVYSQFNNGKEVWFMGESGELVKVRSISKVLYSGKIYDVDVSNDIVLVERNGLVVWSGNSDPVDYKGVNNGSKQGDAKQVDNGKFGKGFEFDGDGDYVDVGNDSSLKPSNITIAVWVKINGNSESDFKGVVVTYDNGGSGVDDYVLGYGKSSQCNNQMVWYSGAGGASNICGSLVNDSNWHFIVATQNSTTQAIYTDAVLDSQDTSITSGMSHNAYDLTIGSYSDPEFYFNGTIDEVMIFNRSLSADEIMGLYNATRVSYTETGLGEGSHSLTSYTSDLAGNIGNLSSSFDVDSVFPLISVAVPSNGSYYSGAVFVNASVSDSGDTFGFVDKGLVSWWRMDDVNGSCYDNETRILTEKGWKYFYELEDSDRVMTLDAESGESEWQLPYEKQEFDNAELGGEMYEIEVEYFDCEDKDISNLMQDKRGESQLSDDEGGQASESSSNDESSPKAQKISVTNNLINNNPPTHPRYYPPTHPNEDISNIMQEEISGSQLSSLAEESSQDILSLSVTNINERNSLTKSAMEQGSNNCKKKTGDLVVSEKHRVYSSSREFLNSFVLNISTSGCSLNAGSLDQIAQLSLSASAKYGVSLSDLCGDNSCAFDSNSLKDSFGITLKNFCISNNASSNCSEVSLEYFNTSDLFFLNSSIAYEGIKSFMPRNSEFIIMNLTGFSLKNDIKMFASTTNCIFYQPSSLYLCHIPSFTLSPSLRQSSSVSSEFSNSLSSFLSSNALLTFSDRNLRTDSEKFNSGSASSCSLSSAGIDNVKFGILSSLDLDSVYSVKDVQLYKGFGLRGITSVYEEFKNGEDVWFMSENRELVKVKNIRKVPYLDKIYDVDVENDIVLVERNGLVVWSGNSDPIDYMSRNNGSKQGDAKQVDSGKFGKGFEFDGNGDYVDLPNVSVNYGDEITYSVWVNLNTHPGDTPYIFSIGGFQDDDAGAYLRFEGSYSTLRFVLRNGSDNDVNTQAIGSALNTGQWYHIVAVGNMSDKSIYINGVLNSSDSVSLSGSFNNPSPTYSAIGIRGDDYGDFNGTIDEVMIFNRSLTADEIMGLYNSSANRILTNTTTDYLAEGLNDIDIYASDLAGNVNNSVVSVTYDSVVPNVTISSPVNDSSYNSSSVLVNVSSSEEGTGFIVNDLDGSLVSWWRMDDVNGSGDPSDYKHCYDNETEVMSLVEVGCDEVADNINYYVNDNNELIIISGEESVEERIVIDYIEYVNLNNLQNKEISRGLDSSESLDEESSQDLIGLVMMSKENENNSFVLLVNSEFEDLIFQDMNASFTSQVIPKGFVVMRVNENSSDFVIKNLSENRIFSSSFVNLFFTNRSKAWNVSHFESNFLKNSSTELYSIGSSFNAFFNSSTCSGLGGSSSTGCQSIASQNSQSSSVTSLVSLYLLNISCFNNLITNFDRSSEFNVFSGDLSSCIVDNKENDDYLRLLVDKGEGLAGSSESSLIDESNHNLYKFSVTDSLVEKPDEVGFGAGGGSGEDDYNKKCYIKKLKYFKDLEDSDRVMTLNAETGEKEWQLPYEKQEFEHNGEMYRIDYEDESRRESELVVSEEHRVYSGSEFEFSQEFRGDVKTDSSFMHSFVICDESGVCEFCTCDKDRVKAADFSFSSYFDSLVQQESIIENITIFPDKIRSFNTFFFFACESCSNSCDFNKSNRRDNHFYLISRDLVQERGSQFVDSDLFFKNRILFFPSRFNESFCNDICIKDSFHNQSSLSRILRINSVGSSSDIRSLRNDSLNSSSVSAFSFFLGCNSSISKCNSLSTFLNFCITNSCSIVTDIENNDYLSFVVDDYDIGNVIQDKRSNGQVSGESQARSSESSQSFYDLYDINRLAEKPSEAGFGAKGVDLSNFALQSIKDVYSQFKNGEEVWFLSEDGERVKVVEIEKVPYKGKIYDVDVENDIILVRRRSQVLDSYESSDVENDIVLVSRRNGSAVWSGNSNNGSKQGDAKQVDNGKFGKGFSFDGDGDWVDVGRDSSLNLKTSLTLSVWVKPATITGGLLQAFTKSGGYYWIGTSDANARFLIYTGNNDDLTGGISLTTTGWHHIAGTWNNANNTMRLYVNGVLDNTSVTSGDISDSASAILRMGGDTGSVFNGTIDEVMIFNRSLSASEIMGLYNATRVSYTETGLSDGSHSLTSYTSDLAGNIGNLSSSFDVDSVFPDINFTTDVPVNGTSQSNDNIFVNLSTSDSNDHYAFVDFDNDLVGWWRMDDVNGSGEPWDRSSYSNNGSVAGDAKQVDAGKFGKGFSFDGDGDYVDVGSDSSLSSDGNISIGFWTYVNGRDASVSPRFLSKRDGGGTNYELYFSTTGVLKVYDGSRERALDEDIDDNLAKWTHFFYVINDTTTQLYVNGVYDSQQTTALSSDDASLVIGSYYTGSTHFFNGTIDEVMIWKRALTADEISALYNASANQYYHNFTGLSEREYNFTGYVVDIAGNLNETEQREVIVDATASSVSLISPLNNSGDSDGNVSFIYNVSDTNDILNCSVIINNAINTSNSSEIVKDVNNSINVSGLGEGSYNWSVNCTDSAGNIGSSVDRVLSVVLLSNEFSGNNSGNTTDLSSVNISNLSNLILENTDFGMINFSESVDLSSGGDIDSNVNVSFNRIEINSSGLPALDKSARLSFYGLTYSDPRPLKDGVVCSDCTEVSYSGGVYVIDVTGFSVYSSEETPVAETSSGGDGSSGGGSIASKDVENFSLDSDSLSIRIVLDEIRNREVKIKNLAGRPISLDVDVRGLEDYVIVSDKLSLDVKEEQGMKIKFVSPEDPGVYTGKIILKGTGIKKEILISLNVQSKNTLFDVSLGLARDSLESYEKIKSQINLLPVGEKGVDVTVKYLIKDFKGEVYHESSETFYVDEEISLIREFKSSGLEEGNYVLAAEMTYAGGVASASAQFEIKGPSGKLFTKKFNWIYIAIGIILILILIGWFVGRKWRRKFKRK